MKKVGVFYWSGSGNTEKMAEAIGAGLAAAGVEYDVVNISSDSKNVADYEKLMFGCPSMGAEQLEEAEFEPFFDEAEKSISGKDVALFGSYGWGDGEWMRNWVEQMEGAGATVVGGEDAICQEAPDEDAQDELKAMGKQLAAI